MKKILARKREWFILYYACDTLIKIYSSARSLRHEEQKKNKSTQRILITLLLFTHTQNVTRDDTKKKMK